MILWCNCILSFFLYSALIVILKLSNDQECICLFEFLIFFFLLIHNSRVTDNNFNPFPPSAPIWQRLAKLSILILEGIIQKISYERRDYESVDEKSLS